MKVKRTPTQDRPSPHFDIEISNRTRRSVPVRFYEHPEPQGLLLFSVGFGGNRDGYRYLAQAWSQLGFVVVVMQHLGSDLEVLTSLPSSSRSIRERAVVDLVHQGPEQEERGRDLIQVLDHFRARYPSLPIGLAGHSFGSVTVALGLGLANRRGFALEPVPNVVGVQLFSPSPPGAVFPPAEFAKVKVECLVVTGQNDSLLAGLGDYRERARVHQELPRERALLAVHPTADHMTFAGLGLNLGSSLQQIADLTGRWWDELWSRGEVDPKALSDLCGQAGWRLQR